jgi:GAF domain-containing protein
MAERPRSHDDPFRWLLNVGATLVASAVSETGLQDVARAIGEAMDVSAVDIQSYDRDNGCLVEEASWNRDGLSAEEEAFIGTTIPLGESRSFRRIISRRQIEELHIDDPELTDEERESFREWGYQTTLDAPMTIGEEVFGVLGVTESRFARRFMKMEHERFELLAGLAAGAIRNAKLYRRSQKQSHRLEALLTVGRALAEATGRDEVFVVAAGAAAQLLGASSVVVHERTADGALLVRATVGGEREDESVAAAVAAPATLPDSSNLWQINEPTALVAADPEIEPAVRTLMETGGEAVRLCIALVSLGEVVGMLTVVWRDTPPPLGEDELDFSRALGEQMATALQSERLAVAVGALGGETRD